MTNAELNDLVVDTLQSVKGLLITKGEEYSKGFDVFSNFKRGVGRNGNISMMQVLMNYKLKHDISVEDLALNRRDLKRDIIEEKINDSIAYLLLLKGMLIEEVEHGEV